ncbi:MAG: hypothetical protein Q8M31_21580 [Beijerinckiaceae bacterium]|nr:hypothetical protein [Beijerinckiaceae bacterium]
MADNLVANGITIRSKDTGATGHVTFKALADQNGAPITAGNALPVAAALASGENLVGRVTPQMASGGNLVVTTSATGADYVAFASQVLKQLTLINLSGAIIEFRQGAAGVAIPVADGDSFSIFGLTNANQIDLRRRDNSATQVNVYARWEA